MTDSKTIAFSLEERGFCVIPEFLSRDEIDFLVEEFDACPDYASAPRTKHAARHLGDKPVADQTGALRSTAMGRKETFQRIRPRMEAFAERIIGAKAALYQILYLQTPVISLPFHQDHDHFFLTEYNRTHLNYWIPLVKPSRTEAGLRLIPWDRLGEKSPRLFNLCRRSGASSLHSLRDGGTLYISDWSGVHWVEENLEIEDVMETPEVGSGRPAAAVPQHDTRDADDRRSAPRGFVTHVRSGDANRLASGGRQSYACKNEPTRKAESVGFPGFSIHPGKRLRHHFGGHRADPDW